MSHESTSIFPLSLTPSSTSVFVAVAFGHMPLSTSTYVFHFSDLVAELEIMSILFRSVVTISTVALI